MIGILQGETKTARIAASRFYCLVGHVGVEPTTNGLRGRSTGSLLLGINRDWLAENGHWLHNYMKCMLLLKQRLGHLKPLCHFDLFRFPSRRFNDARLVGFKQRQF